MRSLMPALLALNLVAPSALQARQGTSGQDKPQPVRLTPLRVSPAATLTQDLGLSQIKLSFARPAVKGRKIWGGLVPYGQVWRTGANAATNVTFSHDCKVAGKDVAAGTYALFAIPTEQAWTLILSKQAKIWGAYDYKADQDALRFEAQPEATPHQEYLDYRIQVTDLDHARIELAWEKLKVAFPVAFEGKAIYWKHLEETLAKAPETDLIPWYQAAQYCFQMKLHLDKALAWSEKSVKIGESMWNCENRARVLHWAGRTAEAIPFLQKAADLSRGKAPKEWTENVEKDAVAWKASLQTK